MGPVPDESPDPNEADIDRAIRRTYAILSLVTLLAEVVWLLDTRVGTRPSQIAALTRHERAKLNAWWQKATAPSRAREQAPRIIWEAWAAAEGWEP